MARKSRRTHMEQTEQPTVNHVYKTAIYVRLSIEDLRKKNSDSIGTQKAMLLDYLQANPELKLHDIYEDVNYTGTNFNRPGFTEMIEDIQAGIVDCILVKDLSRFGRNFKETGHFLERVFPFLQVRFISVNDGYDSLMASLDENSLVVPLKNLINESYARDISKKVQSAFAAKQERGDFCGAFAPYGYIKVGSSFAVDEEAAAVVRKIYEWRLAGTGIFTIVQRLNEQKILPPSRYRFVKGITKAKKHEKALYWYSSAVQRILENPGYTGNMVQRKYKSNFLYGDSRLQTSRKEWVVIPDTHPPIIDKDTFNAVQQIREADKSEYMNKDRKEGRDNIFKGLIFCGDCGKHMTRKKAREKYVYACSLYSFVDKQACTIKTIKEADILAALHAHISHEISLAVDVSRMVADLQNQASFQRQKNTLDIQISKIQKDLEKNRRYRGSLSEDFADDILTEQDYTMMKADYDQEKERLQQELEALFSEKVRKEKTLSTDNKWLAEFQQFESKGKLSAEILTSLVERIDVYDSKQIKITLRYRDEYNELMESIGNYQEQWKERVVNG